MKPQSDLLTAPWLKPIMSLFRDHNFDEAYALAEYFPATPARQLIQCAALLPLDNLAQANTLLKTIDAKMQTLASGFAYLLDEVDIDLLRVGLTATQKKHLYVGYLCLESYLLSHPEAVQSMINGLIELVVQTFKVGDLDFCRTCLN